MRCELAMQKQKESPLALQIKPTYLLGGGLEQWEGGEEKVDRRTFWLGLRTVQVRQRGERIQEAVSVRPC